MIPTAELHLSHHLEHLPESSRLLLVADTRAALTAAREMTASRRGTLHCLLVAPTSFPGAGGHTPPWAVGLESSAGESVVYLTDSALSRAIVERQVSTVRADVRVLTPAERAMDEPATGIAAMKTWRPGERQPEYGRTCWDFRDRTSGGALDRLRGLLPRRRRHSEPEATNAEVLRELLTGRTLDGAPLHIVGHKLTFIDELTRDLGHASGSTIELDEWKNLGAPSDVAHARGVLSRADVIIGEWGRPNNVWIQKHAAPHKRLIVRVHRYEVTTDFPHAIDMDRFDAGVVIVPWVGRALVQKYSWPAEKIVYIPNYVNTRYFRRHKLPGAEHTLGIVGITPGSQAARPRTRPPCPAPCRGSPLLAPRARAAAARAPPLDHEPSDRRAVGVDPVPAAQPTPCCAAPSTSTRPGATWRPGSSRSASSSPPRTSKDRTWRSPKGWPPARCRSSAPGPGCERSGPRSASSTPSRTPPSECCAHGTPHGARTHCTASRPTPRWTRTEC